MRVVIAGAGIGGLATALALDAQGIEVQVYEATREIRPLGVGINLLPHAMAALASLGLLDEVRSLGVETAELCFFNRHGHLIWREPRGLDAGYEVAQVSLHSATRAHFYPDESPPNWQGDVLWRARAGPSRSSPVARCSWPVTCPTSSWPTRSALHETMAGA